MLACLPPSSFALLMGLAWLVDSGFLLLLLLLNLFILLRILLPQIGGSLLATLLASLSSDIDFTMFPLRENLAGLLEQLQGG